MAQSSIFLQTEVKTDNGLTVRYLSNPRGDKHSSVVKYTAGSSWNKNFSCKP